MLGGPEARKAGEVIGGAPGVKRREKLYRRDIGVFAIQLQSLNHPVSPLLTHVEIPVRVFVRADVGTHVPWRVTQDHVLLAKCTHN